MYDSIIASSLILPFFLLSSFLVLNTLGWKLAAGDILYNSNVRNNCGLSEMYSSSISNAVVFCLILPYLFLGGRGFVKSIQSEIWGVLSTGIYCGFS